MTRRIMEFMTIEEFQQSLTPHLNSIRGRIAEYKEFIQEEQMKKNKKNQLLQLISNFQ